MAFSITRTVKIKPFINSRKTQTVIYNASQNSGSGYLKLNQTGKKKMI